MLNNSLLVSLLICKIWKKTKINLGYYVTMVNIWKRLEENPEFLEALNLDKQKIINLAKKYITYYVI